MSVVRIIGSIWIAAFAIAALPAAAQQPMRIDFSDETVGAEPKSLVPVVGRRSSLKWIRNTPTTTREWHDLKIRVFGTRLEGFLDGKLYLDHTLSQPVSGRIGLWSKADSYVYFNDYAVTRAATD